MGMQVYVLPGLMGIDLPLESGPAKGQLCGMHRQYAALRAGQYAARGGRN